MTRLFFFLLPLLFLAACKTKPDPGANRANSPLTLCAPRAFDALAEPVENLPLFPGLGEGSIPITTDSETAQAYFDQGFKFTVAFNHLEAVRSFRYALQQDPECAMCHWGLGYALGPNYNAAFDPAVLQVVNAALGNARQYMAGATEKEQDLIRALSKRYPPEVAEDQVPYEEAYAAALEKLTRKYPDDLDIDALYVEALMNLHPWDLWEKDGDPRPWTPEILAHIESILERDPNHVAAIHLYIHATEASQNPDVAVPYARKLKKLTPAAGHLVHMPSHAYIRTGDYHLGSLANSEAVQVDSQYLSACHAAGVYPLAYYPHNFHFLAACAAFAGDSRTAIDATWRMVTKLDTVAMRQPGLETIQHYYSIPYYLLVKFSKWDDILALPRPAADLGYPTAIWRYARGMAYVAKGDFAQAENELANLQLLQLEPGLRQLTIWDINSVGELLDIAAFVLEGELTAARGDYDRAVTALNRAVDIEDGLAYNEPPDWFFSVRHHLGPVLLEQGDYAAAEALYHRDLELFPRNGYALHGLYESLQKQGRYAEAREVKERFEQAFAHADVRLKASQVVL